MHRHFVRADKGRYLPKYVRMLSVSHDRASDPPAMPGSRRRQVSLALSALAIVYGDIGTSPLYAVRQALTGLEPSADNVLGILSLIFWALVVVVSLKYLMLVMRADNRGEGGILALLVLLFAFQSRGTARAPSLVRDPVSRRRGANDGQAAERRGAG